MQAFQWERPTKPTSVENDSNLVVQIGLEKTHRDDALYIVNLTLQLDLHQAWSRALSQCL